MTLRSTAPYTYNGDGALVDDGTTRYTQDLAAPLSQVLQTTQGSATADYLYGLDRLAAQSGSAKTWYVGDALGSVRMTLDDAGASLGAVNYDPWGTVESGSVPVFGFTGELQDSATGLMNLRARWYSIARGTFTSRDPFAGLIERPQTLAQYAYAENDPVTRTDPSGNLAIFVAGAYSEDAAPHPGGDQGVWGMAFEFGHLNQGETIVASWNAREAIRQKLATFADACHVEPIILVGHSLGAETVMEVAGQFKDVEIDLVITLDIVPDSIFWDAWHNHHVDITTNNNESMTVKSPNVRRQINLMSSSSFNEVTGAVNSVIPNTEHTTIDNKTLKVGKEEIINPVWVIVENELRAVRP